MKRRNFLVALGAGLATPRASFAQPQARIRRIGFLAVRSVPGAPSSDPYYGSFVHAMRDLGYVEGKNLVIEWRFAGGKYDRFPALADELVRLNPEVIVTHSTPATEALRRATGTIPIVTAAVGDPVSSGFAASLARPGGNITGMSVMVTDLGAKQVELLKAITAEVSRIALLVNPDTSIHDKLVSSVQAAAQQLGIKVLRLDARSPDDIERGFATITRERIGAVIVANDAFFVSERRRIAELTRINRLPSMFPYREDVAAGGLMSYGQDAADFYRRAASHVDKIFKGARPSELPFEQPTKIHLAINRKTAKALGIVVPQALLIRADEVIE